MDWSDSDNDGEHLQVIDVTDEVVYDIEFLKDLVIICRFIRPRSDQKKIIKWIEDSWHTPQITKLLAEGFFIVILRLRGNDKKSWKELTNLPMEYWTEETLEKIGRSLRTLIEVDANIVQGDSYLYARIQLAVIRRIPTKVKLRLRGVDREQGIEIEEEKYY
ncbi:hypothetical protein SUGI_1202840 [Cryptomeria japonica]|nr:hypothetical protein SUGI_1202840 [Cryptomeria japonica]